MVTPLHVTPAPAHSRNRRLRSAIGDCGPTAATRTWTRYTEDRALYTCSAGHSFQADVSTSVTCPDCGEPQAW
jgi:hypothetical protein